MQIHNRLQILLLVEKIYRSNGGASTSLDLAETLAALGYNATLCISTGSVFKMKLLKGLHRNYEYGTQVPLDNICHMPSSYPIRKRISKMPARKMSFSSVKSAGPILSKILENNEKHFEKLLSDADLIIDACMLPEETFNKIKTFTNAPVIYNHNGSPDAVDNYWIQDYHVSDEVIRQSNKYSIFCSRYDGILFQAGDQADNCVNRGAMAADKVFVVPPSCQEKEVLSARLLDSPYKENRRSLVCIGSLISRKAQNLAIDAFNNVSGRFPELDLHFVGGGINSYYAAGLMKQVEKLDLGNRVFFHGHREDYLRYMAHAELLIQSSIAEGVSRTLREAMLMKTPIVSFNISGTAYTLQSGREAVLVEPENTEALAAAVANLLNDRKTAREMADAAFQKYLLKHSWPAYADNIKSMVSHFTGNHTRSAVP